MMLKHLTFRVGACLIGLLNVSIHPTSGIGVPETGSTPPRHLVMADFDSIRTDLSDYIWPTDASDRITSSFAEFRTKHFHGGIDLSTNGQTGYNVFAVREGFVERIWITPNGYGKMLYVRHPDGYVSTYAHLKSFSKKITEAAHREQLEKGRYAIDLLLGKDQIPVEKGEIIAFTGETGFGPPHLHFEIRDENLNPVNPLLFTKYDVADRIPPMIRRLAISPLTPNSVVDKRSEPRFFSRLPRNRSNYFIPQTVRIHGDVGFSIDAEDRADGNWRETGIYQMKFFLDDSLVYSMELNRVPQFDSKQIDLHYDLPMLLGGLGRFQKLYIGEGNSLPFFGHKPTGTGIIHGELLAEGEHEYRITVADIQGNESSLRGKIFANHSPKISLSSIDENQIKVSTDYRGVIDRFVVSGKRAYQANWSEHTLNRDRFVMSDSGAYLPINLKPYDVIRVVAETEHGSQSNPLYKFTKKPSGPLRAVHTEWKIVSSGIIVTTSTPGVFTEPPILKIQEGDKITSLVAEPVDLSKYEASFSPIPGHQGVRKIMVSAEVNGKPADSETEMSFYVVAPGGSGRISCFGGELLINYDSSSVYSPLIFQVDQTTKGRSPLYSFKPVDVPIRDGIRVSMKAEPDGGKLGLYCRSNGGWLFQSGEIDRGTGLISGKMSRTLGDVTLMKDEAPPSLGRLRISAPRGEVSLSFRYYDNLSGVDTDEIKLYIDDEQVIPEIDGEHHKVFYSGGTRLQSGKHRLRIAVQDKMKNYTELLRSFTVR